MNRLVAVLRPEPGASATARRLHAAGLEPLVVPLFTIAAIDDRLPDDGNPQALMITTAKGLTDDEIRQAAAYFSALQPRQNIRVLETDMVPKTYIANWHLVKSPTAEVEPIGQRIIEVPDVLAHFESRDTRATFTAYVPTGSVDKGRTLAAGTADLKVAACASCHGKDLRGLEAIPSIAGRSPTYIVRQLHEIKAGIRAGAAIQPMKDVAARLKPDDMVSIAAYLASLPP